MKPESAVREQNLHSSEGLVLPLMLTQRGKTTCFSALCNQATLGSNFVRSCNLNRFALGQVWDWDSPSNM